jgi:serine protease Do
VVLEESSAFIDAAKKVSPSVVSISSSSSTINSFTGQTVEEQGGGTGFILTSDGLIVTNKHVVSDSSATYTVITADNKSYPATIVSEDPFNDLAVIRIKATGLKPVELGDSSNLQIGQWVIAIGNALGEYQNSVTVGVVSATGRQVSTDTETLDGLIQTDAAINPGNSGGPLINTDGQVVGINTAIAGNAEGIGFAITIDSIKTALASVEQTGKIVRPYLGVEYVSLSKTIAQSAGLSVSEGAYVYSGSSSAAVQSGSPADKAGIMAGDVITQINGEALNDTTSLVDLLEKYQPGDKITVTLLRGKTTKTVTVTLGTAPSS